MALTTSWPGQQQRRLPRGGRAMQTQRSMLDQALAQRYAESQAAGRNPSIGGQRKTLAPTAPPPGYYDPAIDSQVRAGSRGLQDLLQDISQGRLRGENDYNFARGDIFRERDESLADLLSGFTRGMEDSRTGESRLREDYSTGLEALTREYGRLAGRQSQGAAAAGVGSSGAFAQAAAKRATNRAIDQQPLDSGFNRGLADLLSGRSRLQQDYDTSKGRVTAGADRAAGQLDLGWQRQVQDWGTQEQRAQREHTFFGQDANTQKWFQARQAGYVAPSKPAKPKPRKPKGKKR